MDHGARVQLIAQPNGDLTFENVDGTITIRQDGTIVLSTVAPIELAGEAIGRLDGTPGVDDVTFWNIVHALRLRGKKP